MTLAEKQDNLESELGRLKNAQDRLAYIVTQGRAAAGLEPEMKSEARRVEGCMAKVWFVPQFIEGRCYFKTDSDSAVVKGIAVLLCEFYSGQTPEEIVARPPAFLEKFGITQHLTPNRRNSLGKIWLQIDQWARAHARY